MSLASVLQTALSGMAAATTTLEVVSNNLANSRTAGFKAGRPIFATQHSATRHPGTATGASRGGGNPIQIGTGVRTAAIATNFSQGPLVGAWNPSGDAAGNTLGGTIELSNTDIGENIVELILASNQFAANALVFRTADSMLDALDSLSRHGD